MVLELEDFPGKLVLSLAQPGSLEFGCFFHPLHEVLF